MRIALRHGQSGVIAASMIFFGSACLADPPGKDTVVVRLVPPAPSERRLVSFTSLAAPEEALKSYNKAYHCWRKGPRHYRDAEQHLVRAVNVHPPFADGWHFLGAVRLALGEFEAARSAFLTALNADSRYVAACLPLALLDLRLGHFDEAAQVAERAIRLNPALTEARYYRAAAYYFIGNFAVAEQAARDVIFRGEGPAYPRVHVILADALLFRGELDAAASEYRLYLRLEPSSAIADVVRGRLSVWQNTALKLDPKTGAPE